MNEHLLTPCQTNYMVQNQPTIQPKLTCKRCAYEWTPRLPTNPWPAISVQGEKYENKWQSQVKCCPRCHSYKWNEPRKSKEVKAV